jgi:hypothetical protein
VGADRFAVTVKADGDLTVKAQREPTGCLGPLLCGGFAGTIVTCLWLLWVFLTTSDTAAGQGAFVPSGRGMLIIASPPFAAFGFVVGAVIGVILYAIARANRQ